MKNLRHILSTDSNKILFWILANAVGWGLGLGLGFTIWYETPHVITISSRFDTNFRAGDFLEAIVIGCVVSILQCAFLYVNQKQAISVSKWMRNSFAGIFLGLLVAKFFNQPMLIPMMGGLFSFFISFHLPPSWYRSEMGLMGFQLGGPFTAIILGAAIAFSQSLLFKEHVRSKVFWIIASSIGLEIAFISTYVLAFFVNSMDVLLVGAGVGIIYGMITAIPLCYLPFWAKPPIVQTLTESGTNS